MPSPLKSPGPDDFSYPRQLVAGDFNSDGRADLAAGLLAAIDRGGVAVLLNQGDGTFNDPLISQPVADEPQWYSVPAFATADLNADGRLDLLVTSNTQWQSHGDVVVLLGQGDGTFPIHVPYSFADQTGHLQSFAVDVFNGDTFADVAVAVSDSVVIEASEVLVLNNDGDWPSNPRITISDTTVTEGDGGSESIVFTASLSTVPTVTVTVDYATANGSAVAGRDYTATSGTLTFNPGGPLSQTIVVPVLGDITDEYDETFHVNLSSMATIGDDQGTATIVDNDPPPTITFTIPGSWKAPPARRYFRSA